MWWTIPFRDLADDQDYIIINKQSGDDVVDSRIKLMMNPFWEKESRDELENGGCSLNTLHACSSQNGLTILVLSFKQIHILVNILLS